MSAPSGAAGDGQGTSGVHAALTRRRMNDDISGILGWWPVLLLGFLGAAPIRGIHAYASTRMYVGFACLMRWSYSTTGSPLHTHTHTEKRLGADELM